MEGRLIVAESEALALTTGSRGGERCESGGGGGVGGGVQAGAPASPQPPPPPPPHIKLSPHSPPHHTFEDKTGKSLPVHCVVETMWSVQEWEWSRGAVRRGSGPLEADSYVIIPVNTAIQDLTQVALHRLGYPRDIASGAIGSVVIQNWKPLSFDQIAESPLMTVGDILGELSTIATLRIQIYRPRSNTISDDMKNKLFRLLLVQSYSRLISSGCPLDEGLLTQLLRPTLSGGGGGGGGGGAGGGGGPEVSEETRRKFNLWWTVQLRQQHGPGAGPPTPGAPPSSHHSWYSPPPPSAHHQEHDRKPPVDKSPDEQVHPAIQTVQNQYPTQKTRMRTSFDPELELPKLQRWFGENQHPSRQQIQQYVKELNSLESRRGRKPLDVNNVVYWFKNARAAQKRAEIRGLGLHMSLNGYNSNSQSPSDASGGGGGLASNKSPGSGNHEEFEEEEVVDMAEPPHSPPAAPLSLTTRSPSASAASPPPSPPDPIHTETGIKQEPADSDQQKTESTNENNGPNNNNNNNNTNNNNNNPKEEHHQDMSEEEDTEDMEDAMSEGEESKEESKGELRGVGASGMSELMQRTAHGGFPMVANSMLSHSIMYMSQYLPAGLSHSQPPPQGINLSALADERRKRNRTFIDPVSEVPRLEQWFAVNTHPSHNLILKYTDDLNRMPYRQKFPPLEPKNVQFWFKNRRAKCKRLKMSLFEPAAASSAPAYHHHHLALPSSLPDPYHSPKLQQ